nr:hypothetical protein CFP56_65491 [Quercus suber]
MTDRATEGAVLSSQIVAVASSRVNELFVRHALGIGKGLHVCSRNGQERSSDQQCDGLHCGRNPSSQISQEHELLELPYITFLLDCILKHPEASELSSSEHSHILLTSSIHCLPRIVRLFNQDRSAGAPNISRPDHHPELCVCQSTTSQLYGIQHTVVFEGSSGSAIKSLRRSFDLRKGPLTMEVVLLSSETSGDTPSDNARAAALYQAASREDTQKLPHLPFLPWRYCGSLALWVLVITQTLPRRLCQAMLSWYLFFMHISNGWRSGFSVAARSDQLPRCSTSTLESLNRRFKYADRSDGISRGRSNRTFRHETHHWGIQELCVGPDGLHLKTAASLCS